MTDVKIEGQVDEVAEAGRRRYGADPISGSSGRAEALQVCR